MPPLVKDLDVAVALSGLKIVELPNWENNYSNGAFSPRGVLVHHTGSYDKIGDTRDDLSYAKWMAFSGRPDLPPPLCNLALSAESVVYICAAGNANHAGKAKASGPLPAMSDGAAIYIGIEAMNSGSQGWGSKGRDASGRVITQYEGYVRLCAALCSYYGWPASHVRAHKETSVTGKWDPGGINMKQFRQDVANQMEDDMSWGEDIVKWDPLSGADGKMHAGQALNQARGYAEASYRQATQARNQVRALAKALDALADGMDPVIQRAVKDALAEATVDVQVTVRDET